MAPDKVLWNLRPSVFLLGRLVIVPSESHSSPLGSASTETVVWYRPCVNQATTWLEFLSCRRGRLDRFLILVDAVAARPSKLNLFNSCKVYFVGKNLSVAAHRRSAWGVHRRRLATAIN